MIISQFTLIELITETFKNQGVQDIVISPGSRNAPIIEAFKASDYFNLYTIADERSAAFFGLGLSLNTKLPTVLVCTSGSAVLNYAPGASEAYYQGIPLIVLSADRPLDFVDQMAGQTINQQNVLNNFTKGYYQLPENCKSKNQLRFAERMISEGLLRSQEELNGPVHFNLPLSEPLYGHTWNFNSPSNKPIKSIGNSFIDQKDLSELQSIWNKSNKILILVGCLSPDEELVNVLLDLKKDSRVIILSESTSNIGNASDIPCIDNVIIPIEKNPNDYHPDLLISLGRNVVSKKVKSFLSNSNIEFHWSFDQQNTLIDTYGCLTHQLRTNPINLLSELKVSDESSEYKQTWKKVFNESYSILEEHLDNLSFCDFKVFDTIFNLIPDNSVVHFGNSSVVRYSNLFNNSDKNLECYSNRGTSGIDGCLSTAVGFANKSDKINTLIIGDISFLYDSNGLWNKHLPHNLRIILINNGGGGIFEIIDGAKDSPVNKEYLKYEQKIDVKGICDNFNVNYLHSTNIPKTVNSLKSIYLDIINHPCLIEIDTIQNNNPDSLNNFFNKLIH